MAVQPNHKASKCGHDFVLDSFHDAFILNYHEKYTTKV